MLRVKFYFRTLYKNHDRKVYTCSVDIQKGKLSLQIKPLLGMSEYSSYVQILLHRVKQFSTKKLSRGAQKRLQGFFIIGQTNQ